MTSTASNDPSSSNEHHAFAVSDNSIVQIVSKKKQDGTGEVVRAVEEFSSEMVSLSSGNMRRLVMEMHAVYTRSCVLSKDDKLSCTQSVSLSRQYRSVLKRVYGEGEMSSIWALFETLCFCPAETPLVYDIVVWGQQSSWKATESLERVVIDSRNSHKPIDEHPQFWNTVAFHLLSCNFSYASTLLDEGSTDEARGRLAMALRSFNMQWMMSDDKIVNVEKWMKKLSDNLRNGIFEKNRYVERLVKMMIGEEEGVSYGASLMDGEWWLLVPLITLVTLPRISSSQLSSLVKKCRSYTSPTPRPSQWDSLFECILSLDFPQALSKLTNHSWIAVHLADLLFNTESVRHDNTLDLRRMFLREYGKALFSHSSLWHLGVDYLYNAGTEGIHYLVNLLCVLPVDTERTAKRALSLAVSLESERAIKTITRTVTMRHLKRKRWAAALTWSLRDNTGECLEETTNCILRCASKSELALLDVTEQLGEQLLQCPSLTLVYNLYRFHRANEEKRTTTALQVLIDTLISPDVPAPFRLQLFTELLRFLDAGGIQMEQSRVYDLLDLIKSEYLSEGEEEVVKVLRLRLCELLSYNLAPRFSLPSVITR